MKYKVVFYCPDRHIVYDGGRLPDTKGVGGGVNARIRLAQSLARLGHTVELICNCKRDEVHEGVHYIPLGKKNDIHTDILVLTTSGDKLDLSPVQALNISARLRVLMVHGVSQIKGAQEAKPDYYYLPSNFIKEVALTDWENIPEEKIFISYRGVIKSYFEKNRSDICPKKRNEFRLAYSGNPIKGRSVALEVCRLLRKIDSRYHLFIFGDERLWGGRASGVGLKIGVRNFGSIPQKKLAKELTTCGFGIFLQTRRESFGQTLIESMTAGCIPIASRVGAYQELIRHGENGFFVDGDPNDPSTWERTASLIHELQQDTIRMEEVRKNAMRSTLDWMDVARAWKQHWDIVFGYADARQYETAHACPTCSRNTYALADGLHCLHCGYFTMQFDGQVS